MMPRLLLSCVFLLIPLVTVFPAERALLVGIGEYPPSTGWTSVHGDNDVALLTPLLKSRGFSDITVLVNEQAKKCPIVKALKELAKRCCPGDKVYFHFSGHGQPIRDDNGEEPKGKKYDEAVIPFDAARDNRRMGGGYYGQNHLVDDELAPLLDDIKRKIGAGGELFVAVDACYSKGIHKDELTDLDPELLNSLRGTDFPFIPPEGKSYVAGLPKPRPFSPGARMTVVTACGSDERNYEYRAPSGKIYGSLSFYISTLLKTNADFHIWRRAFLDKAYRQRRIFQPTQHPSIEIID